MILIAALAVVYNTIPVAQVPTRRNSPWWLSEIRNGVKQKKIFLRHSAHKKLHSIEKNLLMVGKESKIAVL